ncbi:MAG TPA: hypothetical protein VGO47_06310, partial [Chlamydiales bacterium]|nr:hypothetical protein [Chlamydiales bacterium]
SAPPLLCHRNPILPTSSDGSIESPTHTVANDAKDDISQNVEKPPAATPLNNSQSDTPPSTRSTSSENTPTDTREDSPPDPLQSLGDSVPVPTVCNDIPSIPNIPVGIRMLDLGQATASEPEHLDETEDMDTSEDFPSGESFIRYPTDIPDSWIPSSLLTVVFTFDYPDHCEPMDVDFD